MQLLTSDEIVRLSAPERLALISQLWDSLDDDQISLSAAQEAEVGRRLESLGDDLREAVTWTDLKLELEQRRR